MTWLDEYQAKLDAIVASKKQSVASTGDPTLSNAYALLRSMTPSSQVFGAGNPGSSGASGGSGGSGAGSDLAGALGTAWNATKSGGLKLLDYASRPRYGVMNLIKGSDERQDERNARGLSGTWDEWGAEAKDFWAGLSGEKKTDFHDVLEGRFGPVGDNPGRDTIAGALNSSGTAGQIASWFVSPRTGRAAAGLAGDIALDPLNLVGTGIISGAAKGAKATIVGKKAAEAAIETPATRSLADLIQHGTVTSNKGTINDLLEHLTRQEEAAANSGLASVANVETPPVTPTPEFDPFAPLPSQAASKAADPLDVELLASRTASESATNMLGGIKSKRYGTNTQIAPAYGTDTVFPLPEVPDVAPAVAPKPKRTRTAKPKGLPTARARALAFKQHILTTPNYQLQVTAGGKPIKTSIAKLRSIAESDPAKAKAINTMIDQEALRLSKESPEFFGDTQLMVNPVGRTGVGQAAITVDDFQKLLETGTIPNPGKGGTSQAQIRKFWQADALNAKGESPLDEFALHADDDLENLHLTDIAGNRENIGEFLSRMGIRVNEIRPEGVVGRSETLDPSVSVGDQGAATGAETAAQVPSGRRFRTMTPQERKAWADEHKDILDPEDIKLLLKVKMSATDAKAWDDAVAGIMAKEGPTGFTSVDDLMKAVDEGRVSADDLKDLMKVTGAKTPKGIKRGLERLFKRTAELEKRAKPAPEVNSALLETPPAAAVKQADEIVDDAIAKGNDSDLADVKATLDSKQVEDLTAAMNYLVQREIIDPQTASKYGFVTAKGTKRTHGTPNVGLGRNLGEWNKYSQLSVVSGVIKFRTAEVESAIKAAKMGGPKMRAARSAAMYDHVMPILHTIDKLLQESGIPPMLGKNPRYMASLGDVLKAMPREFVEKHFFTVTKTGEHIPPTFWNDAAEMVQDYASGKTTYDNAIQGVHDLLIGKQTSRAGKQIWSGVRTQYYKLDKSVREDYVLGIAKEFMRSAGPVAQQIEKNIANVVIHDAEGAARVTQESMKAITDLVTSPGFSAHDLLRVANDRDAVMESIAKSVGVTSKRAKNLAATDLAVQTAPIIPPEVAATAHNAEATARAIDSPVVNRAKVHNALNGALDDTEVAVRQIMDEAGESLNDLGKISERSMGWQVLKAFAPHLGNKDIRPLFLSRSSFAQTAARSYAAHLSKIARNHTVEDIQAAWKELQNGTRPQVPAVAAAHADLEKVVKSLFSTDSNVNPFKNNGISAAHVNSHFAKYGIHDKYAFDDIANNWKTWDTDDPLDLISRVQAAAMMAKTEITVGQDISRMFGSRVPIEGGVRITGGGILGRFIDPSVHFPRDIAEQMSVLNRAMEQLNEPAASSKVLKMYDAMLHGYKSGLTIYRPAHHIRNMVGDTWLSWMDGVNDPRVYKQALQVMRDNKGRYADFDASQALAETGVHNAKTNAIVSYTTINGKRVGLTTGDVYRMAHNKGLLPDYRTLEDIGTEGSSALKMPGLPGKYRGTLHNAASTLSESRDHYVRISHFIDRLQKSKGGSLDDIAQEAAARVRKWHPDGSDLTHFESKVMRRSFLFYSWVRKAIPLVVESAVHKPGKVLIYPKAMYALGQSMGIDLNSLGDPFPADQLFPSWIRESTEGASFEKDGHFFSVSPGIPSADIADDFLRSPGGFMGTILGSTTPVAKIPVEMAYGAHNNVPAMDIRTGVPKKDLSDYIDQQIPGVTTVANLANRSPSSGFTQSTGVSRGMTPDEVAAAQAKNNPGLDLMALLNLMTGAGALDMSKENYITGGQLEQKRALRGR